MTYCEGTGSFPDTHLLNDHGSTGWPRAAEVLAVLEAVITGICRPLQPAVLSASSFPSVRWDLEKICQSQAVLTWVTQ